MQENKDLRQELSENSTDNTAQDLHAAVRKQASRAFWEAQARASAAAQQKGGTLTAVKAKAPARPAAAPVPVASSSEAKQRSAENEVTQQAVQAAEAEIPAEEKTEETAVIDTVEANAESPAAASPVSRRERRKKGSRLLNFLYHDLPFMVAAVIVALLIRTFLFEPVLVSGPSMTPTLLHNERVVVNKMSFWGDNVPQVGDVVVCRFPNEDALFVKRVVATAGETVEIRSGELYVNGQLRDPNPQKIISTYDFEAVTVPSGCVFVLGDNRNESRDSRMVGAIPVQDVIGRVSIVLYPFDKIRSVS